MTIFRRSTIGIISPVTDPCLPRVEGRSQKQVSVAQIEKRSDFLLSTLRDYVEALGGELELVVKFKDHAPVRLAGIGEKIFSEVPRRQSRSRRIAA